MNIDDIILYEQGELDEESILKMFAKGIASGMVWQLQGSYGRTAHELIDAELITTKGVIL